MVDFMASLDNRDYSLPTMERLCTIEEATSSFMGFISILMYSPAYRQCMTCLVTLTLVVLTLG